MDGLINLNEDRSKQRSSLMRSDAVKFVGVALLEVAAAYMRWRHFN